MFELFKPAGLLIAPHLTDISMALAACLLIVIGSRINHLISFLLRGSHFVLRTLIFIILHAFGYGALIIKIHPMIKQELASLSAGAMFFTVMMGFILIGIWAQRKFRA